MKCMNGWLIKCINAWISEWMSVWMDVYWMNGQMNKSPVIPGVGLDSQIQRPSFPAEHHPKQL